MDTSLVFRRQLAARILTLIAVALPTTAGCSSESTTKSSIDDCHPTRRQEEMCIVPSDAGAPDGGGLSLEACPSRDDAQAQIATTSFAQSVEVKSDATVKNDKCCYDVLETLLCMGRPYLVNDEPRTAAPVGGLSAASARRTDARVPRADDLDPTLRTALAAQWTRDGLFEHASVASFGRFALELLAAGAPDDLVEEAHRSALDEVRHARLCFALASAYAGETIAPGPFPFGGHVEVTSDLASIAARTANEGCIGETIAATVAAEQLANAKDPAVREVLSTIAADEARHAELAWRVVAWAIRTGGAPVTRAVANVFAAAPSIEFPEGSDEDLTEYGRLASDQLRATATRALEAIIGPAAHALLTAAELVSTPVPSADATVSNC